MSGFYCLRLNHGEANQPRDVLMVYSALDEVVPDRLSALVDSAVERDLAPDDMIVIVREHVRSRLCERLLDGEEYSLTRNRLGPHTTVTIVGFDEFGSEAGRVVAFGDGPASTLPLNSMARRAVTAIFQEHGGFVEANTNYHFRNPSGRHTDRFLRLSNLLVRSAEISLVAMTALPLVPSDALEAHVDTPAMFSIVAAINDHLRSFKPSRPALLCDSFRSYFGVEQYDFSSSIPSVVLISASSSGSLANLVAEKGFAADRIGHVLYLGEPKSSLKFATDLSSDKLSNPHGIEGRRATYDDRDCALCDDGSIAVPLVGDQFDIGGPEFEPLTVNKADAPKSLAETMERLVGSRALAISLSTGARRRQYLIDVGALMKCVPFIERAAYFARRYIPSTVRECILLDEGSQSFAERLLEEAAINIAPMDRKAVDRLQRDVVGEGDRSLNGLPILLVAGVIESGRALRDLSRDLRQIRPKSPQIYIVGLAKSPAPIRRQELERTLVQTSEPVLHALAIVEELLLPPSDAPNAWIAEERFLQQLSAGEFPLSQTLRSRHAALKKLTDPLLDDLFVANANDPLALQPGFVFWHADVSDSEKRHSTQADVFYTISSVLQKLRTNPPKPGARALRTNWFQQTRLDPANLGRFNDGVIQASLLRAARPTEIDYSADDELAVEAGRVTRRIVAAADGPRGEAAAEVLIALGSRRLRLPPHTLSIVLDEQSGHPPLVRELVRACRAVLLAA